MYLPAFVNRPILERIRIIVNPDPGMSYNIFIMYLKYDKNMICHNSP